MRVKKIAVSGFRSFVDEVVFEDLREVNVFVGRNNSGKSNFLEILRLVQSLCAGTTTRPIDELLSSPQKELSLSLALELDESERVSFIESLFQGGALGANEIVNTKLLRELVHSIKCSRNGVVFEEVWTTNIVDGIAPVRKLYPDRNNQYFIETTNLAQACAQVRGIANLPEPVPVRQNRLGPQPQWSCLGFLQGSDIVLNALKSFYVELEWAKPIRTCLAEQAVQEARKVQSDGSNLPVVWHTIVSEEPKELVGIGDEIARVVGITSINAPMYQQNQTKPRLKEDSGRGFDFGNTSSGILQVAILITKIRECQRGGAVLIEEPELHLHASAQRALREIIQEHSTQIQFFITTHSTIFASVAPNSCLFLMRKKGLQSSVREIVEPEELKLVKRELGHSNVDIYGYDIVLFVEGDSEELALPLIMNTLGLDSTNEGIAKINVKGKGKASKIGEYLEYLRDSDTIPFVIADGDKQAKDKCNDWVSAGVLPKGNFRIWKREFEDLFAPDLVANCLSALGYLGITADMLENKGDKSIIHVIGKHLYQTDQRSLDKPALAEVIALRLAKERELVPEELRELVAAISKIRQDLDKRTLE